MAARPYFAPWHYPGSTRQHGGHKTLFQLTYSFTLFLSFSKDSHISDACWGWLQPGITPKLCLGNASRAIQQQGHSCARAQDLHHSPVKQQLMHPHTLAALSPKDHPPDHQHLHFLQLLSSQPGHELHQPSQSFGSAPTALLPAGQRRLQPWQHATSCTHSQGISEEIKPQLPKHSPTLPGPEPRASPLSCSLGQLLSYHSSSAAPAWPFSYSLWSCGFKLYPCVMLIALASPAPWLSSHDTWSRNLKEFQFT